MPSKKVIVFEHRPKCGKPVIPFGIDVMTYQQVDEILRDNPSLQATRKSIRWGTAFVSIYQHDLFTDEQKAMWSDKGNYHSNICGVRIPASIWVGNVFTRLLPRLLSPPDETMTILSDKK